jgi:predicted GH43/DUF377 family glycosyl hydrolase
MSAYAQEDEGTPFTLHIDNPIVERTPDSWDSVFTDPGAVIYHDGQFHMFRNGFLGWPASVQIGYLVSEDGLNWTEVSEDPILYTDDVPFAEVAALASSVIVEDDGTWVLYFYTWNGTANNPSRSTIGRATASSPTGPWTVDPEPVLPLGSLGNWDAGAVDSPRVMRTDTGYVMYYAGTDINFTTSKIGMASSEDGIQWTRNPEPILESSEANVYYHQPAVTLTPEGYVMLVRRVDNSQANSIAMSLVVARSTDGLTWEIPATEPILDYKDLPYFRRFWYTALTSHEDTLYLYFEMAQGPYTDIFVATLPLEELPE